jgi:hypothetical protein
LAGSTAKTEDLLVVFYLLGYNAVWSVESRPIFRRNISTPSSGPKNKPSMKPESRALLAICVHAGFLLDLFLGPEDGGDMFLRNVGRLSMDYQALYPRRQNLS